MSDKETAQWKAAKQIVEQLEVDETMNDEVREYTTNWIHAIIAGECTAPAPQPSFWVIERFENGKSAGYWDGASSRDFVADIEKAVHFCRKEDAFWATRGWHWGDTKITEHCYLAAATPQVTPTPEEVRGILLSWTEEELANFWKLSSEPQPAPTEHLIRAMATRSSQSARECFLEMDAFLKHHPNPVLQEKVDKLLSEFPAASVMCIKPPGEGTSEPASPDTIDDGFGNVWSAYCPTCKQKSMYVSGPGDARCSKCETEQASPTPDKECLNCIAGTCDGKHYYGE